MRKLGQSAVLYFSCLRVTEALKTELILLE